MTRLVIGDGNRIREGVTIHRATWRVVAWLLPLPSASTSPYWTTGSGDVIIPHRLATRGAGRLAFLPRAGIHHSPIGQLAIGATLQAYPGGMRRRSPPGRFLPRHGLNLVGLRRAGIPADHLRALKEGYRLLLRAGLRLPEALERMGALEDPLVGEVIAFVAGAKRGFAHAARHSKARDERGE